MPLPLPTLDKLTYDELVGEGRASLPALAPTWTDYNAHDPGIMLLELLAWLAESNSYRLDQIPEQSYRAFLRMAGVVLQPAQVAHTALVFATENTPQQLDAGIGVQSADGSIVFQTTAPLYASDAKLEAVVSGVGTEFNDCTASNTSAATGFLPFGADPQLGDALYLGFDKPLAPQDTEVRLWVWTGNDEQNLETRAQLQREQDEVKSEMENLCLTRALAELPNLRQHYGVRIVWECYSASKQWLPLKDVIDNTRALTLSGGVIFKAPVHPVAATPTAHSIGGIPGAAYQDKYFIRCRLSHGKYDCAPRISYVALNTVLARHAVKNDAGTFRSSGRAGQIFMLGNKPVVPGSTKITVTISGKADVGWNEALSWDGIGPHDRTYVLLPEDASIIFGDGRIGCVPPADANLTVVYQAGGDVAGNMADGSLTSFVKTWTDLTVTQPYAAIGGAAAETLNAAKARAVSELAAPTRAVTLEDFETLALATPGAPVARAFAIADYHPAMPCIPVSGSTTVVVLPPCPEHKPEPTAALLHAVQCYLERRRVLTSEVHVIAPHYATVAVSARLHIQAGANGRELVRIARAALEVFFHPLHGGPDGTGWPIGRSVYRSELLALLNGLNGVAYVDELAWRVDGSAAGLCGNITLCRHGLVASGIHEITIKEGSTCHE